MTRPEISKQQSSLADAGQVSRPKLPPEQLIFAHQGLVRAIARGIHKSLPSYVELDDLISYGQLGLTQAARDFDANRGVQFSTFAYYRIRGAILDGANQMAWFKRSSIGRERYGRMSNDLLEQDAGDSAAASNQTTSDDGWTQGMSSKLAVVFLLSQAGEEQREMQITDSQAGVPLQRLLDDELKHKLHELLAELPEDSQTLLRATYFEGLTLKEAGERLGIGKAWASRLHARCLDQLSRGLKRLNVAD